MKNIAKMTGFKRIASLFLALMIVLSLVPLQSPHVHAAANLKITSDAAGLNETKTFTLGDPIYVTATSSNSDEWVGLFPEGATTSAYWYWTTWPEEGFNSGSTYNIYDYPNDTWDGWLVEEGTYTIKLAEAGTEEEITVVAPENPEFFSLEVENANVTTTTNLRIKTTTYVNQAWVGIYKGEYTVDSTFDKSYRSMYYTAGHNGIYVDTLIRDPGTYTVVLFGDDGYDAPLAAKKVTVTGEPNHAMRADKDVYTFKATDMKIMVEVDSAYQGNGWWLGIYDEDADPNSGDDDQRSYYYEYTSSSAVNVLTTFNRGGFKGGEYKIVLAHGAEEPYKVADTIYVTVNAEIDDSLTDEKKPTCEAPGKIVYTYTDGTKKTVTQAEDPSLKQLTHNYPANFTSNNDEKTHSKVCSHNTVASCTITENCSWNSGVVTTPATDTQKGVKTFTCSVCGGTKTEDIPVNGSVVDESKTVVVPPTCTKDGYTLLTYTDNSTQKVDIKGALGHDYTNVEWEHVSGTKTHTRTCKKNCGEVGATQTENCQLEADGLVQSNALYYNCTKCGSYYESITPTDKTEYAFGEEITVFINPDYQGLAAGDWIGLYKRTETPTKDVNRAIYWVYGSDVPEEGFPLIAEGVGGDRESEFVAGDYTVYLVASDYKVKAARNITITAKETERKTTDPTCVDDGYVTAFYADGTSKVVVTAAEDPSLKAIGHNYTGAKSYNGASKRTHNVTCVNGCGIALEQKCTFDSGKVVVEATKDKDGTKKFTCTGCGGTYTEPYSLKTPAGEVIDKKPTCEAPGSKRIKYTDGTYSAAIEIPMLGHKYSGWKFDGQVAGTHSKTCANDASHKIIESCDFEVTGSGQSFTYTCKVCGGSFAGTGLYVPKTTIGLNDKLDFIAYTGVGGWVGLYKKGEVPGSIDSLYWANMTAERIGVTHNILADAFYNSTRSEAISNGEYVLYLFGDQKYSDILAAVDVTVFTDMSNTKWEIKLDGAVMKNGDNKEVPFAELGTKQPLNVKVTATGEPGASWWGLYEGRHNLDTDFSLINYYGVYQYVKWAGEEGITLTTQSQLNLQLGDYSIVLFEDGTYKKPIQVISFTITRPIVSQKVIDAATCTRPGKAYVVYEDDNNSKTEDEGYIILPALGHKWGNWTAGSNNKHTRKCVRGCTESADCTFSNNTCTVCGNKPVHIHSTKKVAATNATCVKDGNILYYTCECGKYFSDSAATKEIDKNSVIKPALTHAWGKWKYNEGSKTHTRSCGNNVAHMESQACTFVNGVCSVCGGGKAQVEGSQRVSGNDRYQTAFAAADQLKTYLGVSKFKNIVVACGTDFADALSGSYLANQKSAPILLVRNRQKEIGSVADYIKKNLQSGGTIYLLGGEKAIPKAMETSLAGYKVKRLSGATRYETNLEILKEAGVSGKPILVCTGKEFADGLSASAVNLPILLVKDNTLRDSQKAYLKSLGTNNQIYIIGGEKAVTAKMEKALDAYGTITRISGATRYVTSVNIAKTFFKSPDAVVLAYGDNFPDGLSGGPLANSVGAPLILTMNGKHKTAADYVKENSVDAAIVLGGTKVMPDKTIAAIMPQS